MGFSPDHRTLSVVSIKTNLAGAQVAQAIGPLREVLTPAGTNRDRRRFLLLTPAGRETPVLTQGTP
ncbi:hypothetical protein SAMN05216276_102152 [Streptosporangium subroseum]|uniref:Uncharacterized protein n=1 Tax=Streptosporangium subroseum TaxID=106412 RepID=A0A239J016_9ACTN|nr:hypothetical protein [Streptosporangium subroseum]SNS99217.1 hypothetical protein SAMN05216276_102152 [Streptosporangium subroseum]